MSWSFKVINVALNLSLIGKLVKTVVSFSNSGNSVINKSFNDSFNFKFFVLSLFAFVKKFWSASNIKFILLFVIKPLAKNCKVECEASLEYLSSLSSFGAWNYTLIAQ